MKKHHALEPLDELISRAQIQEVVCRHVRGSDRNDYEGDFRDAYWPDALDEHGPVTHSIDDFVQIAKKRNETVDHAQHTIGTISIEFFATNLALVESSGLFEQRLRADDSHVPQGAAGAHVFTTFRYVDRFERRDGEWRISHARLVVGDQRVEPIDASTRQQGADGISDKYVVQRRDLTDTYYLVRGELINEVTSSHDRGSDQVARPSYQPSAGLAQADARSTNSEDSRG